MISRRRFLEGSAIALGMLVTGCGKKEEAATDAGASEAAGDSYPVTFMARVTDAGQYVEGMQIDFGGAKVSGLDENTFEVYMTSTVDYGEAKGQPYAYYDASKPLEVCFFSEGAEDEPASIWFNLTQAPTLTWLAEGRNYPAVLDFTVTQKNPITVTTPDGRELEITDATYVADPPVTSYEQLLDPDVAAFEDVQDEINYRFYKGAGDSLIVWFHGNGEGDFPDKETNNNIAQVLANKGCVGWLDMEAQEAFENPSIMAFQAPNMWYFAVKDGLLEPCYNEIQKVITDNGIDPEKVYVSGCSAGGFMTTRMIIAYPDLFKAAMINCPALDAANTRSETEDACPTDEELASIKDSKTAIWLVQGETDSSVDPELCSKRIWNILSEGADVTETAIEGFQGIASGFTTYETADNKYKLSLYETVDLAEVEGISGEMRQGGKLKFAEDYNWDTEYEEVKYSDHWSWIYTLNNDPADASGTHIWQWAAGYTA